MRLRVMYANSDEAWVCSGCGMGVCMWDCAYL